MKNATKHAPRFPLVLALIAGSLASRAPQGWAEEPADWCGTQANWVATVGVSASATGACPTNGPCDTPLVRDSWFPDPTPPTVHIRVKFNVMCNDNGSYCATSPSAVNAQFAQLNADFAPYGIQFIEGSEATFVNDSRYLAYLAANRYGMKSRYADGPARQLNIFVVDIAGFGGLGTFPWDPSSLGKQGGIVMRNEAFGEGREILTHEVGHNLGLWHTHHGVAEFGLEPCYADDLNACDCLCYERASGIDGDTTGDFASDTPPTPVNQNTSCADIASTVTDTCSGTTPWAPTQVENYMGYNGEACWSRFTAQQAGRMHCWLHDVLTGWIACTSDEECDDRNPCSQETCVAGECRSSWPTCGASDGCCGPTCTQGTDVDCTCGDGVCSQDESHCNCSTDCGVPWVTEDGFCDDGVDNDCNGFADCEDAWCAIDFNCSCYDPDNGGTSPMVCVEWEGSLPPQPDQDFSITATDPNNPNVTFRTGNAGWKVWSQVSVLDNTPANLGNISIDPLLSTANFGLTVAHATLPGAANVASIALVKEDWTGQSNLAAVRVAENVSGDILVRGAITGNLTIAGEFNGDICADNLTAGLPFEHALPSNIHIAAFGPNATICGQGLCAFFMRDEAGDIPRSRDLAFSVSANIASVFGPGASAMEVRLLDLQNPDPPNPPCCAPPDFSTYEVGSCSAVGETAGCVRWVGSPFTVFEDQGNHALGSYQAARLQCTPYYTDWTTVGTLHVMGAEIIPSSTYELRMVPQSGAASCSRILRTGRWADVAGPFSPPATSPQPDALDVVALVNKFRGFTGAPSKSRAQLQPNVPNPLMDINVLDIVTTVDAVRGFAYPFSGPCPCPSSVTCNATPCTIAGACSGGLCMKTCLDGTNAGQICNNNSQCPSGTCGTGFCRDRCGRCTPPLP